MPLAGQTPGASAPWNPKERWLGKPAALLDLRPGHPAQDQGDMTNQENFWGGWEGHVAHGKGPTFENFLKWSILNKDEEASLPWRGSITSGKLTTLRAQKAPSLPPAPHLPARVALRAPAAPGERPRRYLLSTAHTPMLGAGEFWRTKYIYSNHGPQEQFPSCVSLFILIELGFDYSCKADYLKE